MNRLTCIACLLLLLNGCGQGPAPEPEPEPGAAPPRPEIVLTNRFVATNLPPVLPPVTNAVPATLPPAVTNVPPAVHSPTNVPGLPGFKFPPNPFEQLPPSALERGQTP